MLKPRHQVGIYHTPDYSSVDKSLELIIKDWGGEDQIFPKNSTVLLKVNLLFAYHPEQACTTHPQLVESIARRLIKRNNRVLIGDSPGGWVSVSTMDKIFKVTGMNQAAINSGAELISFDQGTKLYSIPRGAKLFQIKLTDIMEKVDFIISIPKLKTHGLTLLTGAVKLNYGFIPGSLKGELHLRFPEFRDFANVLLDLSEVCFSDLIIVDAIQSMEGNGPAGGTPVNTSLLVVGINPLEVDYILAKIMGYTNPLEIPFLHQAQQRNLFYPEKINLVLRTDSWVHPDFKKITKPGLFLPPHISRMLLKIAGTKVVFNLDKCRHCNRCIFSCPAEALTEGPTIDRRKCISCFCCQENCQYSAIYSEKPWLGKVLEKIWGNA